MNEEFGQVIINCVVFHYYLNDDEKGKNTHALFKLFLLLNENEIINKQTNIIDIKL